MPTVANWRPIHTLRVPKVQRSIIMEIGIHLPSHRGVATGDAMKRFTLRAEELGYESLWVSDHVVLDDAPDNEYRINIYDPFEALAYAAALTTKAKLGTSVL